jgi:hypothetical protein
MQRGRTRRTRGRLIRYALSDDPASAALKKNARLLAEMGKQEIFAKLRAASTGVGSAPVLWIAYEWFRRADRVLDRSLMAGCSAGILRETRYSLPSRT